MVQPAIYNACGLPEVPKGACLSLVRNYRVAINLAAGELNPEIQQVVEENYFWRGISIDQSIPNILIRFRSVNNYRLSSERVLARNLAHGGFYSRAWEPEFFIPKGDSILIEAENPTGAAVNTYVWLLGVDVVRANGI